jgi:hypothetical protein
MDVAKNGRARAPKRARAKAPKAKAVDQGRKKEAAPDKGPLSGTAHNLTQVRKLIRPFYGRYRSIMESQASDNASHNSDKGALFEDIANELGTKKRLVRMAFREMYTHERQEEIEAEMDRTDLAHVDTMREALGLYAETPLGQAALKQAGSGKVVQMSERDSTSRDREEAQEEAPAAA